MRAFVLSVTAALSLLAWPAAAGPYANFSLSCTGVDLFHKTFLGATCCHPADDGFEAESQSSLDLAMCIGLDQVSGQMQWQTYGKFSNYCANCTVLAPEDGAATHVLSCLCTPLTGGRDPIVSTLNLDDGIANDMGTLKCAGGLFSSPPLQDEE